MTYRTVEVKVRGGPLRVGIWESVGLASHGVAQRTVLGVHGITSSHLAWTWAGLRMIDSPSTRLIAPDLRGRGQSAALPGPWGMRVHADDLSAVVDQLGKPDLTAGHSMGAFAAVVAAHRYPGRFGTLLLVDGGVPLPLPADEPLEVAMPRLLGPTATRLAMRFPNPEEYRRWWRDHPAFAGGWSPDLDAYVDYDLVHIDEDEPGTGGHWRSAARLDAVGQDFAEQGTDSIVQTAWNVMASRLADRVTFLRAPLGLQAEPPGLYPIEMLNRFAAAHPTFHWTDVPRTNHYSLLLTNRGAQHVAATMTKLMTRPLPEDMRP